MHTVIIILVLCSVLSLWPIDLYCSTDLHGCVLLLQCRLRGLSLVHTLLTPDGVDSACVVRWTHVGLHSFHICGQISIQITENRSI